MADYPEIDFVDTNAETIETELVNMYEEIVGHTVYPASPERLFIQWLTQIIVQQRVIINDSAKKNVPRYATGEDLDSLAELFGDTERLQSSAASAMFRFYLAEPQEVNITIPSGTRITPDGDLMFATQESIVIKAGELYGDVAAVCQTLGEDGNDFAPGQVNIIIDPYDYYDRAENLETTAGGAETETDNAFYLRMRDRQKGYSTAGPMESYIYHAKSVSSAIVDATANSPEPGVVDVRILIANNTKSPESLIQDVQKQLTASKIRPLTDYVKVSVPDEKEFAVDVSYWITEPPSETSLDEIKTKVGDAVNKYIEWQTGVIGRDINPSKLYQYIMDEGIKRMVIREPGFEVLEDTEAAKNVSVNITYEGIENE
jgi:phage-related baseplate assembly protein